jgi:hypothetical protein
MTRLSRSLLLEEEIDLLVKHFGLRRVRDALAKVSIEGDEQPHEPLRKSLPRSQRPILASVADGLESIRESAPEKYRLLTDFLSRLKNRDILPESQDIRHFAQLVGLKEISGKSRRDMIPKLMRFLLEQPFERLRIDIQSAGDISEQQRQRGFSVLTDKLIGKS